MEPDFVSKKRERTTQDNPDQSRKNISLENNTEDSNCIVILNLQNIFNISQLEEFLKKFGSVKNLWMDNKKSHSYVEVGI
jgi:RNA recognition motif-containing protein